MVELQHGETPEALLRYCQDHPAAVPADFDSRAFQPTKAKVKSALNRDQGGLCAYCEKSLAADAGQVDHIKPQTDYPALCFNYTNYAHSCINPRTCGQKKKRGLLPIEPAPGCNADWTLSTDGTIEPVANLTNRRRHEVCQTRDMLGLNADAGLVDERRAWLARAIEVLRETPDDLLAFLRDKPFRYILRTAFSGNDLSARSGS